MSKILLVDDDTELLESLSRLLAARLGEVEIYTASDEAGAVERFEQVVPDVAVIDLSLKEGDKAEGGYRLLKQFQSIRNSCRVIVLTGHGALEYGVRAIAEGAAHFLEKPANIDHLEVLIADSFRQAEYLNALDTLAVQKERSLSDRIVGSSEKIEAVREQILYAASHDLPVLLRGETGTGKGLCAGAIHELSGRSTKAFVRYQPASSNGDLVQSELFGHKKGAFTGAEQERAGLIRQAASGTLFLDEIDEFPLETQVFLLGVLQDKKYRCLGDDQEYEIDFRLICATNCDIEKALSDGKMRKDFYHRVAHLVIELPSLRERKEDILPLCEQLLADLRRERQIYVTGLDQKASSLLLQHEWPGNIRELIATIENAAHLASFRGHDLIMPEDLKLHGTTSSARSELTFHEQVSEFKKELVTKALQEHGGNQVQTARVLGVDRSTLRRILEAS